MVKAVRNQTFTDDLANRHTGIQRRIRILEDELQITAELPHFLIFQTSKVNAIVTVSFVFLEALVILIGLTHLIQHFVFGCNFLFHFFDLCLNGFNLLLCSFSLGRTIVIFI